MRHRLLALALAACPSLAAAQTPPPSGPLVIERLESRFVVAPDYKVTEIDGDTGQLLGGYAGWLAEDTLLVGGAVYTLADGPDGAELTYGGLLIGWSTPPERRIQFGARGLAGVGRATLGGDITRFASFGSRRRGRDPGPPEGTMLYVEATDTFLVFEPQLMLMTRLTDRIGLTWGAGYRLTGDTGILDDRLRGFTGSLAVQLTGW